MSSQHLTLQSLRDRDVDLGPWSTEVLTRTLVANGLGLVLICLSWYKIADALTVPDQITWANVGLVGLGVAGVGNAGWLRRGRRSVGVARAAFLPWPGSTPGQADHDDAVHAPDLVHPVGTARFHRRECPFAEARDVAPYAPGTAGGGDLIACEVCDP